MSLCLTLTILLFLVLAGLDDSVWRLPPVSLGYCRTSGRLMVLAVADLLWDLWTVGSSVGNVCQSPVALFIVALQGGLQNVVSLRGIQAADLSSWLLQISWDAFRLMGLQKSSSAVTLCVLFFLGDLQRMWSVALHAVELLPGLQSMVSIVLLAVEFLGSLRL